MKKILFGIAIAALSMTAAAQTITFDTNDYRSVGVYDTWENSPFRTGALSGNAAVINNHLTAVDDMIGTAPNTSAKILGVQRSRFGSNTFGARVDLNSTFELTTTTKYVHVLIYKPVEGRVMLVGLGKRTERADQSEETEQFWVLSTSKVEANCWCDAVFPIKGAGGIDIYSLVVVPDCESPHGLSSDFMAYIDNIEINNNVTPRIDRMPYPLNIDEASKYSRTDRYTSNIQLGSSSFTVATSASTNNPVYTNLMPKAFLAKAGTAYTPKIGFTGHWMHGYIYIDYGQDGKFNVDLNSNGTPTSSSDLISYNYYNGKNSSGSTVSETDMVSNNVITCPNFTIPAGTAPGFYRMRYIVDWNSVDPGGNIDSSNHIISNGGSISDVLINIHEDNVSVSTASRNGEVTAENGATLSGYSTPFNTAFTIKMNPENGFSHNGVIIRHGYNLDGDSVIYGNHQWSEVIVPKSAFRNGKYTVPASYVDGNILIEGVFVEKVSSDYPVNFDDDAAFERHDRGLRAIGLGTQTEQVVTTPADGDPVYTYLEQKQFQAKAGETVSPTFTYTGSAMHGYVYVDYGNDGEFSYDLNSDGTPATGSDIVTYSYYDGKNSSGSSVSGDPLNPPSFTIPAGLADGFYRMRYKVDYDDVDPAGRMDNNNIIDNRGGIVDIPLNIHGDNVTVTDLSDDGEVLADDGTQLVNYSIPFGEAFTVKVVPEAGYYCSQISIRHGHNLSGPQMVHGTPQWTTTIFSSTDISSGRLVIPAGCIDGDLQIEATFLEGEDTAPVSRGDKLSALPDVSGWYQISSNDGTAFAINSAETANGGNYYPLHTGGQIGADDANGYIYIEKDGNNYKFQSANGHYLDKAAATTTQTAMSDIDFADATPIQSTSTFSITINNGTCTDYNGNTVTNTTSYFKTWTSNTSTPTLLLYQGVKGANAGNNMQRNANGIYLFAGNSRATTEYTLEVPEGYIITGWRMVFRNRSSSGSSQIRVTPASGGSAVTSSTYSTSDNTVTATGLNSNIAKFTLQNQRSTTTTNYGMIQARTFEVYVESTIVPGPCLKLPWVVSGSTIVNSSSQSDWDIYKLNNVEGNYDIYKVSIVDAPDGSAALSDKAQAIYPNVASGLSSVYDNGYFFVEKGKRILPLGVSGTSYNGYVSDASIDEESKTITLTYRTYTPPSDDEAVNQTLWNSPASPSNNGSAPSYRIPAVVRTSEGSLLAVSDHRYNLDDIGSSSGTTRSKIELVFRHSTDEGATWTASQLLSTNSSSTSDWNYATGDAAVVADRESGKVLVYCASGIVGMGNSTASNPIKVGCFRSNDNGHTWDSGTDVTSQMYGLYNGDATAMFITSGSMHQSRYTKVGNYYRVYAAFPVRTNSQGNGAGVMYSDDFGATWQLLGGTTLPTASVYEEARIEELPDGSIILMVRDDSGRTNDSSAATLARGHKNFNIYTFTDSRTGAGYWSTAVSGITGMNNATNNKIILVPAQRALDGKQLYVAVVAMPSNTVGTQDNTNNYGRKNMCFYFKEVQDANDYISGQALSEGWAKGLQISNNFSAYSDIIQLNNGYLGVFYEGNGKLATGLNGNQYTECYDMIFSSFSLERITSGRYVADQTFTDRTGYFDSSLEVRVGGKVGKAVGMIGEGYDYINDKTQENMEELQKDNVEGTLRTNLIVPNRPYYIRSTQTEFGGVDVGTVRLGTDRTNLVPVAAENGTISEVFSFQQGNNGEWKLYSLNNEVWAQPTPVSASTAESVSENAADAESFVVKSGKDGWSAIISQNPGTVKQGGLNCSDGETITSSRTSKAGNPTAYWYIEPLEEWTITMKKVSASATESYSTMYLPFSASLPENTQAYIIATLDGTTATTQEVYEMPANTPFILKSTVGASSVVLPVPANQYQALVQMNELDGVLRQTPITDREHTYVFSAVNGKVGFYRPSSSLTTLAGNKAFLMKSNSSARGFALSFDGSATGIDLTELFGTESEDTGNAYDLQGRRVVNPGKGVYIINGKKVYVK